MKRYRCLSLILAAMLIFGACGESGGSGSGGGVTVPSSSGGGSSGGGSGGGSSAASQTSDPDDTRPLRESTPVCLVPEASGTDTDGNELALIDYSHTADGYIMVDYLGTCEKVKLQITGPNEVTYTYNITNGYAVFPLSSGDGNYTIAVCENIEGNRYSIAFKADYLFTGIDEFGPYLHPNQYVNFTASSKCVAKGAELASACHDDLEVVTSVYDYITGNITYDYEKADTVKSGYIPDVDEILDLKTGICLDYAAMMATMLRSQQIPTRLEVGYAGEVYHAWISVYIKEVGWLNGIIQFHGNSWSLVDPTFGANTDDKTLKDYIGDGSNYSTKYIY